jgi:predicted ester cyclase
MSTEANTALVRRLVEEGVNQGHLAVLDELIADDFMVGDAVVGRERFKRFVARRRGSFPDWHITVEAWVAAGDTVVIREAIRGTHAGVLETPVGVLPPTGRHATWTGIQIWRIADGRVAQWWGLIDELRLLQQLGALPAPAPAAGSPTVPLGPRPGG